MSLDVSAKRRLLRPTNSLPLNASAHTTEAHNARQGVKDDVTMSLMNVGWRVRKSESRCMRRMRFKACGFMTADCLFCVDVTEGYKTGPPQAVPTPPRMPHLSSSLSNGSGAFGTSYSSSDAGSTRSTYTSPALATPSLFLSSSDALWAAKTEIQQEQYRQQLEREQIAMLNSLKPRRDLMCLADVVDVDAGCEDLTASRLSTSPMEMPRADNYHLYSASRAPTATTVEEEPYRPERGRKRHTVEEDEGEATEVEDDDAEMDVEVSTEGTASPHRPIRPIKRSTAAQTASGPRSVASGNRRALRPTQSAPGASFQGYFGVAQLSEHTEREVGVEGGLRAWVGKTDF